METILIVLHVFVCLFLIFVVLLQSGQAADLAGAFGGGGSQTALGMRGAATLLQKLTTASAIIFMLTSLSLGIVGRTETSVIDDTTAPIGAPVQDAAQVPGAGVTPDGQASGQQESGQGSAQDGAGRDGSGQDGSGRDDAGPEDGRRP